MKRVLVTSSSAITKTCVCGKKFTVYPSRAADGRGKFCSNACKYANASRPPGLHYEIKVQNRAWLKPGHDQPRGADAAGWRGEEVGYQALHRWVKKQFGSPPNCERCGTDEGLIDWANKSHEYRRALDDWLRLCRRCHWAHDQGFRGVATKKYGAYNLFGYAR